MRIPDPSASGIKRLGRRSIPSDRRLKKLAKEKENLQSHAQTGSIRGEHSIVWKGSSLEMTRLVGPSAYDTWDSP